MGAPDHWIASPAALYAVIALMVTAWLITGTISALVTVFRLKRDGVLAEDQQVPARTLHRHMRDVLASLSLSYFVVTAATAALLTRALSLSEGGWLLAYCLLFLLHLVGAVSSKALAVAAPFGYARAAQGLVWALFVLLWPLTKSLAWFVNRIAPTLRELELSPPLSGPELRDILADEDTSARMEEDEADWARSIFELRDTELREIMVPRIDTVGLDVNTPAAEAVRLVAQAHYTRLPVWDGSPDKILGLVHAKDLLAAQARGEAFTVRQILRRIEFLPESKRVDEALSEFRERRVHLAVVVDEYGGTAGIVTLEDILEEVFGEIRDEFDQEGELIRIVDARRAVIDPRIDLDDLNEALNLDLPTEESDTLAGFLYQRLGRVPVRGDEVGHGSVRFMIDRVERQRIRQVTLQSEQPLPSPEAATGGAAESAR